MGKRNKASSGLAIKRDRWIIQETSKISDPVQNTLIKMLVAKCINLKSKTLEDKTISISELCQSTEISKDGCRYEQICEAINTLQKTLVPVQYRFVDLETDDAEVIGLSYFSEIYTNFSPASPTAPEKLKNEENPYLLTVYWNPVMKNFVAAVIEGTAPAPNLLSKALEMEKNH